METMLESDTKFKTSQQSSDSITPQSSNNSRLNDIYFQLIIVSVYINCHCLLSIYRGYDTFSNNNIINDDGGIEYESTFYLPQVIEQHPNQSRFSSYSMEYLTRMHSLNKAISTASTKSKQSIPSERIYTFTGELYRRCCFTDTGMKFLLSVNIVLVLLNMFLIIYEIILVFKAGRYHDILSTNLPIEFFICDLLITIILIIEVLLHWYIGYMCSCWQYLCNSTCDNKIDVIVMTISVICCVLYGTDFDDSSDIDNLLFLAIRILRDFVRIIRCFFFFKLLRTNLNYNFDGINQGNPRISKLAKLKSAKSQLLWDTFIKQKELNPQASMLKVNQSTLNVAKIKEEQEYELSDPFDSSDNNDVIFVPSKVTQTQRD